MQINNISKYQNEVYDTSKHYESDAEFKDILSQMLQSDSEVSDVVKNFRKKSAFGCWSGAFFL